MKAAELRIGNFVSQNTRVYTINSAGDINTSEILEPVPLTEEWLVKLGLNKKDDEHYYLKEDDHQILIDIKGFNVWFDFREEGYYCAIKHDLKHVHKLQNFYFELNDRELVIANN